MNLEAILGVINKGLSVLETAAEAGNDIVPILNIIKSLTQQGSSITQADLDATERQLDKLLDELEAPLPDA